MDVSLLELWSELPDETQEWLLGTASNALGGVAGEIVNDLRLRLHRRDRKAFEVPEHEIALQRAVANSFTAALNCWVIDEQTNMHYCELFKAWLLRTDVLDEFKLLLTPHEERELDVEFLCEEFEDCGFDAETLLTVPFGELIQEMVGAFYLSAAQESDLREPLKIKVLCQMVERMGVTTERLEEIKSLNKQQTTLQEKSNEQDEERNRLLEQVLQEIRAGKRLPASLTQHELNAIEQNYRQTIINLFETLTFKGISPSGRAIALPLEDVYVELKAVAEVPEAADTFSAEERRLFWMANDKDVDEAELKMHLDTLLVEHWREKARKESKQLVRRSIHETLNNANQHGIVILGDPGSGKTTLLHYLALQAAQGEGRIPEQLPIFVPLAAYDAYLRENEKHVPLGNFLEIYHARWRNLDGLGSLFVQALESGRALVLLDGLDEVLEKSTRQFVANQAETFIQRWAGYGNRFVLTSRVVGYRETPLSNRLPHVTVLDFGRPEIEQFTRQWSYVYETWVAAGKRSKVVEQRAEREMELLLADVRSNKSVERLAANPLLLTMLALLRRQVGKLPDRRIELYERYTRTLIDNWEESRSQGARQQAPERFDPHTAIFYLIELAFWLQQHKPSGTASRRELETQLVTICLNFAGYDPGKVTPKIRIEAQQEAARFLKDMRHFAGLLAERGHDAFGFLHLTFQEYFTGRALARMSETQRQTVLKPYLHHPRWREPILLCAGQLGVIEQRRDQVSQMVTSILHANCEHEAILHRDKFLAVAIAKDDVGLAPSVLKKLAKRLILLQKSNIPTVRDHALAGLAQLAKLHDETALDALHCSLDDEQLTRHVIDALKPVIASESCISLRQALLARLSDESWRVRQAAVAGLASLVPQDQQVRQALLARLSDSNSSVRQAAVAGLTSLVAQDQQVRQALLARLSDSNSSVRQAAVAGLASFVAQDKQVRQALLARLSNSNSSVRQAAVAGLASFVAQDQQVRQALLARLSDESWRVRQAAVAGLASLVVQDKSVRQALLLRLSDNRNEVRETAMAGLASLVGQDKSIREAILACLSNSSSNVRQVAVAALAPYVRQNNQIRQALLASLSDPSYLVGKVVVVELAAYMGQDETICQALLASLSDSSPTIRRAAVVGLTPYIEQDEAIRQALFTCLSDSSSSIRQATVVGLRDYMLQDKAIHQALLVCLSDFSFCVRQAVVVGLARIVVQNKVITADLLRGLDSIIKTGYSLDNDRGEGEETRQLLANTYGPLLVDNLALLNKVIKILDSPYPVVSKGAAQALVAMLGRPPAHLMLKSRAVLDDNYVEEDWPERLQVAELLINERDRALSQQAIDVTLEALDFATQRRYHMPSLAPQVRKQAAQILGQLEPLYRDERVFARLARVVQEDEDEQVRDAAYGALLRLVAAPQR